MSRNNLKITIITVCFNAAKTIERTIESVCAQSYPNIEYIVKDGASTDETLEIIKRYTSKISKFVSEKDNGIYDAMNKSITLATGDIVYFLNADDRLYDNNVVRAVVDVFSKDSSRMLVYGNVVSEGRPSDSPIIPRGRAFLPKTTHDFLLYLHRVFCHQAIFARRELFSDVGKFNCKYICAADYDWIIRVFKFNPACFFHINKNVAYYFYMGSSYQRSAITRRETAYLQLKYFFCFESVWYVFRYIWIRGIKKRILNEKW